MSTSSRETLRCRPILVLGVDRSGTSLIAEMIHKWGAHAGDPSHLLTANENNARGFWEYVPLQQFLVRLEGSTGVSQHHPAFCKLVTDQVKSPALRDAALRLIAEMQEPGKPWMWKEPDLSLALPFWQLLLKEPLHVVAVRNPYDSALSYEKFVLPPKLRGRLQLKALFLMRWQHYLTSVLKAVPDAGATLFVRYESLLAAPEEECARLCAFLDRECDAVDSPSPRIAAMRGAIQPGLWRTRTGADLDRVPEASPAQRELYALLKRKVQNPRASFDAADYPLPPCWPEYMMNIRMLEAMLRQLA